MQDFVMVSIAAINSAFLALVFFAISRVMNAEETMKTNFVSPDYCCLDLWSESFEFWTIWK
jgi:hypothetical protein